MADSDLKSRMARGMAKRGSGGETPPAPPPKPAIESTGAYGGRPTKRTSMVLYHDALREMQYIAVARDTNVSVLVREAIDEWLATHGDGKHRSAPAS